MAPGSSTTLTPTQTPAGAVDVIASSLRNAGFEDVDEFSAPYAWEKYGGALASDVRARSGARAARLDSDTTSTKWVHQSITVESGSWYVFEAWVLHGEPAVASAFLRISWYASADGGGAAIDTVDSTSTLDVPSPGYRFLTTGSVAAPSDARSARVRVMLAPVSDASASILVDDAWFSPAAPPTSTPSATMPASVAVANGAVAGGSSDTAPVGARSRRAVDGTTATAAGLPPSEIDDVVINEVLYDADSDVPDADAEWIEIYNGSDQPVDLAGWSLRDATAQVDVLPAFVVPAHGFAIVATTDAVTKEYPDVAARVAILGGRIGNGLGNDGDRLYLADAAGAVVDAISWGKDTSVFDPPVGDVPSGHSIEREFAGVDSNSVEDFVDNERPSPGSGYQAAVDPRQRGSAGGERIIEGGGSGAMSWLPWAVAAVSAVTCASTLGWRTIGAVRRVRQP